LKCVIQKPVVFNVYFQTVLNIPLALVSRKDRGNSLLRTLETDKNASHDRHEVLFDPMSAPSEVMDLPVVVAVKIRTSP
jgi:hypothetical protein